MPIGQYFPKILVPDFVKTMVLGDYGVKAEEMGVAEFRLQRSRHSKLQMTLEYIDRPVEDLQALMQFYHHVSGELRSFRVPIEIWRHSEDYAKELLISSPSQYWRFSGLISVSTVMLGFYSFNIDLVSLNQAAPTDPAPAFPRLA